MGDIECDVIGDIIWAVLMRAVLDTDVLVAGLGSRQGASHALLRRVVSRQLTMLASPALWLEYESVLQRPHIGRLHGLSQAQVGQFLDAWAGLVEPVNVRYAWRPQLNGPNDEMVLDVALNAGADALVTFNVREFRPAAQRFFLRLLTPSECFSRLEQPR